MTDLSARERLYRVTEDALRRRVSVISVVLDNLPLVMEAAREAGRTEWLSFEEGSCWRLTGEDHPDD